MKCFLLLRVLLLFVVSVSVARAGTWVLPNGDRVSGVVVSQTAETLTIQHPQLGRLEVPRAGLVAVSGSPRKPLVVAVPPVNGTVWKRQVEFGYSLREGLSSSQNLSARLQLDARNGDDSYEATARVLEAESNGAVTSSERGADFRWRRQLNPTVFAQTLSSWNQSPVRQLNQQLEQQVGGGLKVFSRDGTTANIGLGAAVRYQDRAGVADSTGVLGTLFQDFAHKWTGGLSFSEQASVALASDRPFSPASGVIGSPSVPVDGGNYRVRFNSLLQGKVTPTVTFNVRYDYDFDRSVPDPSGRTVQGLTTSLGYAW